MQVVLCYDISDDGKRAQMAREVIRFLDRVQKSTYEGDLSPTGLAAIRSAANRILDHETDSVRIYQLCAACHSRTEVIGIGVYIERDDQDVIV